MFDRQMQKQLYNQPDLNKWLILSSFKDKHNLNTFVSEMYKVFNLLNWHNGKEVDQIEINGDARNPINWINTIDRVITKEAK